MSRVKIILLATVAIVALPTALVLAQVQKNGGLWIGDKSSSTTFKDGKITLPAGVKADPEITAAIPSGKTLDGASDDNTVRGIVRAIDQATISTELNARILAMPFKEGDYFNKGDVIVKFDCVRTEAELASARAVNKGHKLNYDSQALLKKHNAAGSYAVEAARADFEKSGAEVRSLEAKVKTCTIIAPYNGRVAEKMASAYEIANPNQPLLKIINDGLNELNMIVPSRWLAWLKPGSTFEFDIDETGKAHTARITKVGGAVDPVSQTVRILAKIEHNEAGIIAGMSGTARFKQNNEQQGQ